jgi:hypothetical protein
LLPRCNCSFRSRFLVALLHSGCAWHLFLNIRPFGAPHTTLSWPCPSAAWDHYIASGQPQQKTLFPNNSSVIIEVCLPCCCIETVVLLLLHACSFQQENVYKVIT